MTGLFQDHSDYLETFASACYALLVFVSGSEWIYLRPRSSSGQGVLGCGSAALPARGRPVGGTSPLKKIICEVVVK